MSINKMGENVTEIAGPPAGKAAGGGFKVITGSNRAFTCLYLQTEDTSGNLITAFIWPSTTGALRGGTTEPTVSTQDTAGSPL